MRSFFNLAVLTAVVGFASGCGTIRTIEQWKCDNMGLCHFGIRPSGCDDCCDQPPTMAAPMIETPMMPAPMPEAPMMPSPMPEERMMQSPAMLEPIEIEELPPYREF